MSSPDGPRPVRPVRRPVGDAETQRANRADWDAHAEAYQREHGEFLGDVDLVWGPEGLREAEAGFLGPPAGRRTLEVGCGAAQGSRWLRTRGAEAVGLELSEAQLAHARRLDRATGVPVATVLGTATRLPFRDGAFDVVFSAYGALPFVADAGAALAETARVLRAGGRFAFSLSHPVRWAFPDDPGPAGLRVTQSYWDRTPYVEEDAEGRVRYVEHHRTLGDWVGLVHAAGLVLESLHEPEWPPGHDRVWGGWGPDRGRLLPGTVVLVGSAPQ